MNAPIGFGTYGDPPNDLLALMHHDLGLPHVLGFESLESDVDLSLGVTRYASDDDRCWSSVKSPLSNLLRFREGLCDIAAMSVHKRILGGSRSFRETIWNVFKQAELWQASHVTCDPHDPKTYVSSWGLLDPNYITMATLKYSLESYPGFGPKALRKQWEHANAECTKIAAHNVLAPLWNRSWKPAPPLQIHRTVGKKVRTLYLPRNDRDKLIFMVLSCLFQHVFPWPSNCHSYVPGRGVHTAAAAFLYSVGCGYRYAIALDVKDAFPSTCRVRAVQKIAASIRRQNNEAMTAANPFWKRNSWMPGADWDDATWVAYAAFDIPRAYDAETKSLVNIEHIGLLPGTPVGPVGFNLLFRALDQDFVDSARKGGPMNLRYADNLLPLGHSPKELMDGVEEIRRYCRGLGLSVRIESDVIDLHDIKQSLDFLGLTFRLSSLGPHVQISEAKIDHIAEVVRTCKTLFELAICIRAVIRHYVPYGLLGQESLYRLCELATKALDENQWLATNSRAEALVNYERVRRVCARTSKRCRHKARK